MTAEHPIEATWRAEWPEQNGQICMSRLVVGIELTQIQIGGSRSRWYRVV